MSVQSSAVHLGPPWTMEFRGELGELGRFRQFCRHSILSQFAPADVGPSLLDALGRMDLAGTEALTNVIRHGIDGDCQNIIQCATSVSRDQLCVTILHHGARFEPTSVPIINHPLEGGMGLYLIERCVDEVSYLETPDGRQCIRLLINLE